MGDAMTTDEVRYLFQAMLAAPPEGDTSDGIDPMMRAALTLALAALDATERVRALVNAAYADGSPLLDREAIRRALDGEAA